MSFGLENVKHQSSVLIQNTTKQFFVVQKSKAIYLPTQIFDLTCEFEKKLKLEQLVSKMLDYLTWEEKYSFKKFLNKWIEKKFWIFISDPV